MVENSYNMVIFSHHHQIQMLCQHLQLQNHNFNRILLEILSVLHLVSMLFDFVTTLDGFSHVQIHIKAHTMSQRTHLACEMNQVGANDENPNTQRVPDQPSDENPPVESQSAQSSEPRLPHPRRRINTQQFKRNVRARQSTSSFPPVPSCEAVLAFSADSLEPACLSNKQWKKVGVEVRDPLTADMFENPEDDWLATASSTARARVEVNIKKLSADERPHFRAAQD